jgi:hypothetical protein
MQSRTKGVHDLVIFSKLQGSRKWFFSAKIIFGPHTLIVSFKAQK